MSHCENIPPIADDLYFDLVIDTARKVTGKTPIVLRNPYTGHIFWVQGMHNCPRETIARAAAEFDALDERELLRAVLH